MTAVLDFKPSDIPPPMDDAPPNSAVEYPCKICGKEAGPYGGRGRKPVYCPEHKKGNKGSGAKRALTGNDAKARAAASALVQLHGLAAMGLMITGMPQTASALAEVTEAGFEERAYEALLTDPALCSTILKAGTTSGRMSLLIAYAMLAGAVVPTAWQEVKSKRATESEEDAPRPID